MNYVFSPPAPAALPVVGVDAHYPVRRIYCVGRNYAAHAIEMGHDPDKEPPFFFQKNPDSVFLGEAWPYPPATEDLHHEIEMVVALRSGGRNIPISQALDCVFGYATGLDMTRRDLQAEAKRLSRPWELAKSFELSAPMGPLTPVSRIGHPSQGSVSLTVNGELRQQGDLNQMIWKVPEVIAYLSILFELAAGDLIMSGTPSGVGAVQLGDRLEGRIDGLEPVRIEVV